MTDEPIWASEDESRDRPLPDQDAPADVDPYSVAVSKIRAAVRDAIQRSAAMSDRERSNLLAIEEYVRELDNA